MSIHGKLLEFHKRFKGAEKTGFNPHFKQAHFTLEDVNHAVTPILNDVGVYILHHLADGRLVTVLIGEGEDGKDAVTSAFPLPVTDNPQVLGSAITYGKRYNLCALLNISEPDDDGEAAAINQPQPASMETLAAIRDYLESMDGDITPEMAKFFDQHPIDKMTETQAVAVLARLKDKKNVAMGRKIVQLMEGGAA